MIAAATLAPTFSARYQRKLETYQPEDKIECRGPYELPPGGKNGFAWQRSKVIALACQRCHSCHGMGLRAVWHNGPPRSVPCNCVLRAIFRACLAKARYCSMVKTASKVSYQCIPSGRSARGCYGRKNEEFAADLYLVARRHLDAWHWRVFELHHLAGLEWRACLCQIHCDRGEFFHSVYRIEQRLGRAFAELKPHALFPIDEYFAGMQRPAELYFRDLTGGPHYYRALPASIWWRFGDPIPRAEP